MDSSPPAAARLNGVVSAACSLSFAHGRHGLPHGSQTGPPPQRAECVRCASPDPRACAARTIAGLVGVVGLTRRPEPARPLRCANRFAGYADASLCYRHVSVARQAEAPLREHGDRRRTRSAGREFGDARFVSFLRQRTSHGAAPAPHEGGDRLPGLAHEAVAPATMLLRARLGLRLAHAPARADCHRDDA